MLCSSPESLRWSIVILMHKYLCSLIVQDDRENKMMRFSWLWPAILILSTIAVGLVTFVFPDLFVRPIVVLWFLFVCPGMVVIRFLRLKEPVVEWTIALALS